MIREISPAVTVLLAFIGSIAGFVSIVISLLKLPFIDDLETPAEA